MIEKIKDTILNLIKNNDLVGHFLGYLGSRSTLLKIEIREEIAKVLSKGLSYAIILISALFFLLFFSVGLALYLNTLFCCAYLGYGVVSAIYLLVFILFFTIRKKMEKEIEQHIIEITKKDDKQ